MAKRKRLRKPILAHLAENGTSLLLGGFIAALVLGGLASIFAWGTTWVWLVLIIGIVAGITNLARKEVALLMLSLLTSVFTLNLLAGLTVFPAWLVTLFNAVVYLLIPFALLISLKVLYNLSAGKAMLKNWQPKNFHKRLLKYLSKKQKAWLRSKNRRAIKQANSSTSPIGHPKQPY